ncbi:type I restriction-modification system subunit M N-terminal domain-containing protein [Nitrosomonas sp.]|uniref:type I restriction-modification system subunit M N-terminal domain-containing protein n=1 Tax=Nitrosomonas sp. TaxID=42353 RepID=UPI00260A5528|nr:type I restriction-modification system subunit M N-terminal domain-containing protein [Nitrosomonas sp.]MCW5601419.1 hypothetical protein [Nitrosomonas sp.]
MKKNSGIQQITCLPTPSLTATEYKDPVPGLILLLYAQNRHEEAKVAIEASIPEGPRGKRAATQADFLAASAMMLPQKSQYDYLANLPEEDDISEAVSEAMLLIATNSQDLRGVPCIDHKRRTKIDIVFENVIDHVDAEIKHCPTCDATVKGVFPSDMRGSLQYGDGLEAFVINFLIGQMVALNRVQKLVK